MKLSEVPIVEIEESVRVPTLVPGTDTSRGRWTWHSETRTTRMYDFGSFKRGGKTHEKHVYFHTKEFACDKHEEFQSDCTGCYEAAMGPDPNDPQGPLIALRKSRGIEVTAE